MESVSISGMRYEIRVVQTGNRTASARLRNGCIVIGIPSRWPEHERRRARASLLARAVRAIETGRWAGEPSKVMFSHGQRLVALGMAFEISFIPSARFRTRAAGGRIEVSVDENRPGAREKASRLAGRRIIRACMPALRARVDAINARHFSASVPRVTLRDNTSRWGSCSADGSISLSLRLLFMPEGILDYVIVHELAHTRYKSHGPRFWALVERVLPDHRERRRWLRENGWSVPGGEGGAGGPRPAKGMQNGPEGRADCFDEPY